MTSPARAKTFTLPEVLDIKATQPLAEGLLAQRGAELMIDASRVARLGAQSLQILLSAISTWRADGMPIEFVRPSVPFIEGLELLGIDPESFLIDGHLPGVASNAAD
jgi:chemotaxis protein CheX